MKIAEDKLDRSAFMNKLFNMLNTFGNQDGRGLTIAINGRYGSGKTTLLEFIKEKNEGEKQFDLIEYNAWETNIFDNPLFPILDSLSGLKTNGKAIKDKALKILKKFPHILLDSIASVHGVDFTSLLERENFFDEYNEYKKQLQEMKNLLAEACKEKKILLLIDEMDRCLPEYQIKVLETVYHLLDVPNLIVIVAMDRSQLECSVNKMFGNSKNVTGYLTKFIDYEIDLPDENDTNLYVSLLNFHCSNEMETKQFIANIFKKLNLGMREVRGIAQRINLICKEKNDAGHIINYYPYYCSIVSLLMTIKCVSPDVYKKFFSEEKTYAIGVLKLSDTEYGQFLQAVSREKLKVIFVDLDVFKEAKYLLIYFINCFYPVNKIDIQSVANYSGMECSEIESLIERMRSIDLNFPHFVNDIIRRAKVLI